MVRHFQRCVNTKAFFGTFYDFKSGIDYNDSYFKIVNKHYILVLENKLT